MQLSARASETEKVNPQDVAVAPSGALWIARLGVANETPIPPSILVEGVGTPTTIDLSKFDADGNPDASSVRIVGDRAFVTLERLTNDVSVQPSQMIVLDTSTLALVTNVTLAGRNPFGQMHESNGNLWLADPGNFNDAGEADAGIEVFDTTAMTSALVATEADLGGSVVEVAVSSDGACGAAILADASTANRTSLVSFSIVNAKLVNVTTLVSPTDGFDLRGLFWTAGDSKLLVADTRATQTGFPAHVFANAACTLSPDADLFIAAEPALAFAQ